MFQIGDIVGYSTARNLANNEVYGIVVGFNHNDYYYVDWFSYKATTWDFEDELFHINESVSETTDL